MVSPLFFSQLVLFALIWLVVILHLTWPKRRVTALAVAAEPEPLKPKHHRSNEPKAFEGLTPKPHCALCERDTAHPKAAPPVPPDPMAPTNRRPREVATSMHFCPHNDCDYRGWLGLDNLRANGHPSGGPWRQFHCTSCNGYFLETHGTLFHGKQATVELIVRVLACLAEGLGIRATARVFEVDPNTVLHWLVEAAEQLRAFSACFLCDLHVEQLQLDELYAVLRDLQAGKISDAEATRRQAKGPLPKLRWMLLPKLLYTQVVKAYRRRRIVGVKHRVVFGTQLAIEQVLEACGWTINTAFVERLNLDIRQRVAAIGRRVNTLCQGEAGLRDQLALFQVYHNFVLPHASLSQPLAEPMATKGRGSAKLWRPSTPAMAAGLTDRVWSLKEVLLYRVPPWPQAQMV